MEDSGENLEVLQIAGIVADANEREIPLLLAKLKPLFQKNSGDRREMGRIYETVWKYDLLSWCAIALKYDFNTFKEGPELGVTIFEILSESCCNLNVNESQEFSQSTLISAVLSSVKLLKTFQQLITENKRKPAYQYRTNQELVEETFDRLTQLITCHPYLCKTFMNSGDTLRLLMGDGGEHSMELKVMALIQRAVRVDRQCLPQMTLSNLHGVLDEIVYKLTTTSSDQLAHSSVKLITLMSDAYPHIIPLMVTRFKGLKVVLSGWKDHGFDSDLLKFVELLEAGSAQNAQLIRKRDAALTIWAYYKGWKTRTRVNKLKKNLPRLQESFRSRRRERKEQEEWEKSERDVREAAMLERKRSFRKKREEKLQGLEILPAGQISLHIQNEESKAATLIQAHWKAHKQRNEFKLEKISKLKTDAAVVIQRKVRKYFGTKKKKSLEVDSLVPTEALTKEKREKYERDIAQWQTINMRHGVSRSDVESNHQLAQEMLLLHHRGEMLAKKDGQSLDSLLAKIHTEEEILKNLPSLSEISQSEASKLSVNSSLIQNFAQSEHHKLMTSLSQPWWKQLNRDDDVDLDLAWS